MSRVLSAASGPPSTCCSGDCPYPALLCAPELAQAAGTTQEAPLCRMRLGSASGDQRVGGVSSKGICLLTPPPGLPAVLAVAAFLSSHGMQEH